MTVVDRFVIKGLGTVTVIDALPEDLAVGMKLKKGDQAWVVCGIETHAMPRDFTNGKPAGLLLREEPPPEIGDELCL